MNPCTPLRTYRQDRREQCVIGLHQSVSYSYATTHSTVTSPAALQVTPCHEQWSALVMSHLDCHPGPLVLWYRATRASLSVPAQSHAVSYRHRAMLMAIHCPSCIVLALWCGQMRWAGLEGVQEASSSMLYNHVHIPSPRVHT